MASSEKNINRREFLQAMPAFAFLPLFLKQKFILSNYLYSSLKEVVTEKDKLILKDKFKFAETRKLNKNPINKAIIEIAKTFIGTDYQANPIELEGEERLVINLRNLDCVTFYEASLVIARCVKKKALEFEDFKKELQFIRYRNGIIDGYPSRLHYTTDYFYDNERKGVLEDITKKLGGVIYKKKIDYMSTHFDLYPKLKESQKFIFDIQEIEKEISGRKIYHIPKNNVKAIAGRIKDGDILGITTNITGLDCSHTGIAIWRKKHLHMIHASIETKKVQITEESLYNYLANKKNNAGIIVVKPMDVNIQVIDC